MSEKKIQEAYILAIGLGFLGIHHIYLNRKYLCVLYVFTGGLFGIGYIVDLIRMPTLVRNANAVEQEGPRNGKKTVDDVYLLWITLGLLGFHHFYLKNYKTGILYACTCGVFGIGWIVDGFFLGLYVRRVNNSDDCFEFTTDNLSPLGLATALSISPFGIFGAHHYYLGRIFYGLVYTFTLGLFGIGYIIDWFRTPILFIRYGNERMYIDDAYILWFFLGFFGIHQFYLRRKYWGILYALTFGVFGVGWIIDSFYLKNLVKQYNKKLDDETCEKMSDTVKVDTRCEEYNQRHVTGKTINSPHPYTVLPIRTQQSNLNSANTSIQYSSDFVYSRTSHHRSSPNYYRYNY